MFGAGVRLRGARARRSARALLARRVAPGAASAPAARRPRRPRRRADAHVPRRRPRRRLQRRRRPLHAARAGASTTSPSTASCCASRRPASRRSTTTCFGWHAPYPLTSLPVLLGTAGGIGLLVGPAGLLWLNLRRDPLHGDPAQRPMDRGFIALLLLTSVDRPGAARLARHGCDGAAAGGAPRRRDGAVPHAALRQVRARRLPLRGAAEVRHREAAAQPAAARRATESRFPTCPTTGDTS